MGASSGSRERSQSALSPPVGFDPERGFWTEDYIDNAATVRFSVYRRDGSLFCDQVSNYDPPDNGIHLCGVTDDEQQPTTVAVYPMVPASALDAFQIAKGVAECAKDEADFIVDLCIDDSIEEDFWSNRQLWSLAIRAWNAAIVDGTATAAACEDMPVPQDCQARAESIAPTPPERKLHDQQ